MGPSRISRPMFYMVQHFLGSSAFNGLPHPLRRPPRIVSSASLPHDIKAVQIWRLFSTASLPEDLSWGEGLKAEDIIARSWQINDESDSDWRSHAAAAARSIHLIKGRMQWKRLLEKINQLDKVLEDPDLWQDPERAAKHSRERGAIASRLKSVRQLETELAEHVGLAELAREENDLQIEAEATKALGKLREVTKEQELAALLSDEHDFCSCFLEVQAGAGGTESMDWAAMVMRMYRLWATNRGFDTTVIEEVHGDEAGIKRATLRLDGEYAFGYAKSEAGVHRLVRISPFDSNKRRHTSFAAVAVIPINESGSQVNLNEADLRIDTFCSGGPGGQHANKTESAVRIVHLPTGITAQCQSERSQHKNKQLALAVLQARLQQREMAQQAQAHAQHTASLGEISWGNQIRSYVLHPYRMVKDLRTSYEVSDPDAVLDGDLDGFINSFLVKKAEREGKSESIV